MLKTLDELKKKGFDTLKDIVAIDRKDSVEVVYLLYSLSGNSSEQLSVKLDPADLAIDTVTEKYPAADWYEREMSEMFGIKVRGRVIRRLLLEEWNGVTMPLRKDFVWGTEYKKR